MDTIVNKNNYIFKDNKIYNKIYNKIDDKKDNKLNITLNLLNKIPNVSKFEKELTEILFKQHIDNEFFCELHQNSNLKFLLKNLYHIDESKLNNYFINLDNYVDKIGEIVFEIYEKFKYIDINFLYDYNKNESIYFQKDIFINQNIYIPQKVIHETFVTCLSIETLSFVYDNNIHIDIYDILLMNTIDYIFDELLNNNTNNTNNINKILLKFKKNLYNIYNIITNNNIDFNLLCNLLNNNINQFIKYIKSIYTNENLVIYSQLIIQIINVYLILLLKNEKKDFNILSISTLKNIISIYLKNIDKNINKSVNKCSKFEDKYKLIYNFLKTYFPFLDSNTIYNHSLCVSLLDDFNDMKEDYYTKQNNSNIFLKDCVLDISDSDNTSINDNNKNIILNKFNKLLIFVDKYLNNNEIKKAKHYYFYKNMIYNMIGLSIIRNKMFFYNDLINNYENKVHLPLNYINVLTNSSEFQRLGSMHYNRFNYLVCYYIFNLETRFLKYTFDNSDNSNCLTNIPKVVLLIINEIQQKIQNILSDFSFFNNINLNETFCELFTLDEKYVKHYEFKIQDINNKYINNLVQHVLQKKGKMIRSIFNILLYLSLKLYDNSDYLKGFNIDVENDVDKLIKHDKNIGVLINYCSCLELIHLSSLIHDDVIDESTTRRNQETVNFKYSNKIAILFGDYLVVQIYKLIKNEELKIENEIYDLIQILIVGEINEIKSNYKITGFNDYIQRIYQKTGYFLKINFEILYNLVKPSGHNNDYSSNFENSKELLKQFGLNLGIGFQIKDDMLDYTSNIDILGKNTFDDLYKGIVTAPYLFAYENNKDLSSLLTLIELQKIKKENVKKIFDIILQNENLKSKRNYITKTQDLVNAYINNSLLILNKIIPLENTKNNIFLEHLLNIIKFVGSRDK